jgi:hypothetical protein
MRSHRTIAALLSSALIVGCNGRNNDNPQNSDQNQAAAQANAPATSDQTVAPAPQAQAQQPYSTTDSSAASSQRATTGRRESVTPRASTPSQNQTRPSTSTYNAPPAANLPASGNSRAAAVEAPAAPVPQFREVTVPAGTELALEMTSAVSSESAQIETPVTARLRNAVVINGDTAIPAGTVVSGTVTDVERSGRVKGLAHLSFAFNEARMNGGREDIRTNPVTFQAEATKGEDATKVGIGAGAGAILGGILGGKKGAGKGAIAGGAVGGGVVAATRGKEVVVAEGTNVTATLAQPLTLRIPIR